jgi:hypothetical protein
VNIFEYKWKWVKYRQVFSFRGGIFCLYFGHMEDFTNTKEIFGMIFCILWMILILITHHFQTSPSSSSFLALFFFSGVTGSGFPFFLLAALFFFFCRRRKNIKANFRMDKKRKSFPHLLSSTEFLDVLQGLEISKHYQI